jgi:hypothetical protein
MLTDHGASSATFHADDYVLLQSLLDCEAGWATELELSWNVAGDDLNGRRQVRALLASLGRQRVLERIFVRNNREPLACVFLDHQAVRDLLDGPR